MNRSPASRYDPLSQWLHWVTAVVVIVAFTLGPEHFGRSMREGLDPATRADIVWHESLGVLVFVLTLLRLAWALGRPAAPRLEIARWMRVVSRVVQGFLWLLLIALPLTAIVSLGSEGHPLTLLGGLRVDRMPAIADSTIATWADWGEVHGVLGDLMIWLAGLHAAAAIVHHVVLKDGVLRSMLPGPAMR